GIGWSDRLAMRLSEPLIIGQTYQLSFYDRAWPGHCTGGFSIGLSSSPTSMGTYIHNTANFAVVGVWKLREFSFVAPVAAEYITVLMSGFEGCWQHVDNFCLSVNMDCAIPTLIKVPNVFTPNSDGVNDRFMPFEGSEIIGGSMDIYNRWGKHVFSSEDMDQGWDSISDDGQHCPDGVYFYRLTYSTSFGETETTNGSVTLLRN
nr:gliding motility-associated C-terminal domain-containing protein [Bacteroidota bacterium]